MVKLLFVLMNEYRLWAMPQALATLEERYPGASEGQVYSIREVNASAELEQRLLDAAGQADMAFLASHGSIQNLTAFPGCGRRWLDVRFTSPPPWGMSWRNSFRSRAGAAGLRRSGRLLSGGEPGGSGKAGAVCAQSLLWRGLPSFTPSPIRGQGIYSWRAFCRWRPRGPLGAEWPRSSGR